MTHSFFGGVYPATRKDMTRRKPLSRLSRTPKEIVIPLIMCADGPVSYTHLTLPTILLV